MAGRGHRWSHAHAERLLWRAGFGATPKEIDFWATRSRERAIDWVIRGGRGPHGTQRMVGPAPRANGRPLDPINEWGHDVLWWLDKMVRGQRPLQEKLTLFWHDHFATRDQGRAAHAGPELDRRLHRARRPRGLPHADGLQGRLARRPPADRLLAKGMRATLRVTRRR